MTIVVDRPHVYTFIAKFARRIRGCPCKRVFSSRLRSFDADTELLYSGNRR